ncbi:unnamed protein product, partial [Nesidiocoris tenuis]
MVGSKFCFWLCKKPFSSYNGHSGIPHLHDDYAAKNSTRRWRRRGRMSERKRRRRERKRRRRERKWRRRREWRRMRRCKSRRRERWMMRLRRPRGGGGLRRGGGMRMGMERRWGWTKCPGYTTTQSLVRDRWAGRAVSKTIRRPTSWPRSPCGLRTCRQWFSRVMWRFELPAKVPCKGKVIFSRLGK